jgi:hypothetical protein
LRIAKQAKVKIVSGPINRDRARLLEEHRFAILVIGGCVQGTPFEFRL